VSQDDYPRYYTRPDGVEVEVEENGDQRFSGEGGGVLLLYRDENGKLVSETIEGGSGGFDQIDALFLMRDRLLEVEDGTGQLLFPAGKVDVAAPEVWREIFAQKGELQSLIEALLQRRPQFFRDIADRFNPGKVAARRAKEVEEHRDIADGAVIHSIGAAATLAGGLPSFAQVLSVYRNLRSHVRKGSPLWEFGRTTSGETSSNLRKKLKRVGNGWICRVKD
jgi:hypothetical protein